MKKLALCAAKGDERGHFDSVVHSSGVFKPQPVPQISIILYAEEHVINIWVMSTFLAIQPRMKINSNKKNT